MRILPPSLRRLAAAALACALAGGPAAAQRLDFVPEAERPLERFEVQRDPAGGWSAGLRIVGGTAARPGEWPFTVLVVISRGAGAAVSMCGGSVIDRNWVLTAAHCVVDRDTGGARPPAEFRIIHGSVVIDPSAIRVARVARVVAHPRYDDARMPVQGYDIALLQTREPLNAPPIVLAAERDRETLYRPGTPATVVGWGATQEQGDNSQRLMQVSLPLVDFERCAEALRRPGFVMTQRERVVCAGVAEGGRDSCQGDSGGPLFVATAGPPSERRVTQLGIVSWGEGCARPGRFGVYERVAAHEAWIRQHVPGAQFSTAGTGAAPVSPANEPSLMASLRQGSTVRANQEITLRVESSAPGFLVVASEFVDPATGEVAVGSALPNLHHPRPPAIRPGQALHLPGEADRFRFFAPQRPGDFNVTVYLFAAEEQAAEFARTLRRIEDRQRAGAGRGGARLGVFEAAALGEVPEALRFQIQGTAPPGPRAAISRSFRYEVR